LSIHLRNVFAAACFLLPALCACGCKAAPALSSATNPGKLAGEVGAAREQKEVSPVKTPPAPDGLLAFDFGKGPVWRGFSPVPGAPDVSLSEGVSFGEGNEGVDFPDPLIGDYAAAERMTVAVTDLKKGSYRAAVIAQDVAAGMVPAKDFSIAANDRKVVEFKVTPEWYFSENGFFYGIQFDDLPDSPYWERYADSVAPWRRFTFESDGRLTLELVNCRLYALVVAPAAEVDEKSFDRFIDATQMARKAYFLLNKFSLAAEGQARSFEPSKEDEARGYVVFRPDTAAHVTYNTVPAAAARASALDVAAAPGERVPLTFAVHALADLSGVNVSVSDLVPARGAAISSAAVAVASVRYMLLHDGKNSWRIWPETLRRRRDLAVPRRTTKQWWLTIEVPDYAQPGAYSGTVVVKAAGRPDTQLALRLQVYPFALAQATSSIGVWYDDPSDLGYVTGLLGGTTRRRTGVLRPPQPNAVSAHDKAVDAYRIAMLDADLRSLHEHGFNGVTVQVPTVVSVSTEGKVTLDFGPCDAYRVLLKKYAMNTQFPGQTYLLSLARQIAGQNADGKPVVEFSDLHKKAYKDGVAQVRDYWLSAGYRMLAYAVDEPREKEINPWNRNMADTLEYLRLIREVGGWPSTVTTMADVQDDVSYMPILEGEDVVQPHPGSRDADGIKYARKAGKPLRYFNGGGFLRYDFGFYIWSQKPEGYWQWHFDFRSFSYNPFWENSVGYCTFPGPDGPVPTLRYERTAQGIYDYRYALTLEDYIAKARQSGKPKAVKTADEAAAYLDGIRKACTPFVLDNHWRPVSVPDDKIAEWRAGIVKRILALQAGP